ncbi:MAG: bifunctional alpha,alpha-trehalose-phosphate synthase (UDP-forming)/trehalose-phosphatase [Synergistetes bacterium]|nr:bifunctional alpha,alpha-trehalose-phosphate synthase (UDP-forming)/trehalose-phosphatase [Synergistota bacterium]
MKRLVIVSNRLPYTVSIRKGEFQLQRSVGGLATGLSSFYKSFGDSLWVGWPGVSSDRLKRGKREELRELLLREGCYPVFLSQADIEGYYYGFSNKAIWPLFHYFPEYAIYDVSMWRDYERVNSEFCKELLKILKDNDIVWIHDYHLMLLPKMLRKRKPDLTIGFFLHIPFPSYEVFRLLPWRSDILSGMLGSDLVGFHTYDYALYFLDSVHRILGLEHTLGQIWTGDRSVKVDAFPMGIDYHRFSSAVQTREVQREIRKFRNKIGDRIIVLSMDRLDYTKGILERLSAFEAFLERYPAYREKVTFLLVAVPSRTKVERYMELKRQVDEVVGRINGRFGTIGWVPIWYLYRSLPFHSLVALYSIADIALITPLRDGMNLVAKEYLATKIDGHGVLILSEMAGASKELGEAIIVNPEDKECVISAIKTALEMGEDEQRERNRAMQDRLRRYTVIRWANDFMERLFHAKNLQKRHQSWKLSDEVLEKMVEDYLSGEARLLFLDYDGTLVPFADRPEKAKPDSRLKDILRKLSAERKNEVVIISGRDRGTLEKWFGKLGVSLVAEHGAWIKEKGGSWRMIEALRNDWKTEIKPILEFYVDRTPGTFIEEKEFSLAWHYRKADIRLASFRARELKSALLQLTENFNLVVLEGSRVIEVRNLGVNKGRAANEWLVNADWDFILAMGDDWTDEDMFFSMPERAYTIKVGFGASNAKYYVDSYTEVRRILRKLISGR